MKHERPRFTTTRTEERIAENTTRSGVFLTIFEVSENVMTRLV